MIKLFKTFDHSLMEIQEMEKDNWVHLMCPTDAEIRVVSDRFGIPTDYLKAALDEEERSRIEVEADCVLIIVDVPLCETVDNSTIYTTLPLGIVITDECIVTITTKEIPLIDDFVLGRVKSFFTFKKTRFILQLLYKNAMYYLLYLKLIDKRSGHIEKELHKSMKNKELIQLLDLEKSLVYFSTSLRGNEIVLEKMLKLDSVKKYSEDEDLLEDVIIENKQAIEMANIYSNILSGTMDAFASVISNNLNMVMKFLTSFTIVLTIPTMVASFFGMNVPVPLSSQPHAFIIIMCISLAFSGAMGLVLFKKKMF